MEQEIVSQTKFVTTGRVALFESIRYGRTRVWEQLLRPERELTAQACPYVYGLETIRLSLRTNLQE